MIQFLIEGFLLGIATGLGCVAHCGPIYAPLLMQKKMKPWESVFMVLEISAGRFVAYIAFGILIGIIGQKISPNNYFIEIATAVSFLVLSVMMIMAALGYRREEKGCSRNKMMKFSNAPFLLGLLTGIHICPSFLIALTNGLATKGPLGGAMLFFGFYMGTNVWLMPFSVIGFLGNLVSAKNLRRGAMFASIMVGAWFIGKATTSFTQIVTEMRTPPPVIINVMDEKPLYIVGAEDEDLTIFTNVFEKNRKGKVALLNNFDDISEDSVRILVTPSLFKKDSTSVRELLKPGSFIGVLPLFEEKHKNEMYGNRYAVILASYFANKHLIVHEKGTYFHMKDMLNNKGPESGPIRKKKSGCGTCPSAKSCGV